MGRWQPLAVDDQPIPGQPKQDLFARPAVCSLVGAPQAVGYARENRVPLDWRMPFMSLVTLPSRLTILDIKFEDKSAVPFRFHHVSSSCAMRGRYG